jgi:molybdate transport system substrate-binding protein
MTRQPMHVFCAGAVKHAFLSAAAQFERDSGHSVSCTFAAVGTLLRQHADGEKADFLLLNRPALDGLLSQGKVLAPVFDVGTVGVGIAVRSGSARPDLASSDALRRALLDAPSLSYGDPAHGDSSGTHFSTVIARLGIADAVAGKTRLAPSGLAVAELVRDGHVHLGATQASVIAACSGVELAALLPAELQHFTTYACGCAAQADAPEAAQQLLDYLRTARARETFASSGFMVPGNLQEGLGK